MGGLRSDDARCDFILTYRVGRRPALAAHGATLIDLEETPGRSSAPTNTVATLPEAIIYVVYTSGSTGRPKGVMVSHRPLMNIISAHRELMPTPPRPRTLQFASLNFDVSFHETFFTWLSGGTVFLISDEDRKEPLRLASVLERPRNRYVVSAPEHAASPGRGPGLGIDPPSSLRNIVVSGERLEITPALRELHRRLPELEIHNHYGSNESHVVTVAKLAAADTEWPRFPSRRAAGGQCNACMSSTRT